MAGAVAAAPAMATTAPSMITNGNATNSVMRGPGRGLSFYWAANGVPGWTPVGHRRRRRALGTVDDHRRQ
jgi:hypothetical protein